MAAVTDPTSSVRELAPETSFSTAVKVHHQVGGRGYVVTKDLAANHPVFSAQRFWNLGSRTVDESDYVSLFRTGTLPASEDSSLSDDLVIKALNEAQTTPLPLAIQAKPKVYRAMGQDLAARVQVHHQPGSKRFVLRKTEIATHPSLPAPLTIVREERPLTDEEYQKLLAQPSPSDKDFERQYQELLSGPSRSEEEFEEQYRALLSQPSAEDGDAEFQKALEQAHLAQENISDEAFDFGSWALQTGLWDGHPVAWEDAAEFQKSLQQKISALLATEDPQSPEFQRLVAGLACTGVDPARKESLLQDLQALGLSPHGAIIQVGFWKNIGKFCSKYKKEILVGVAIVAVVTVIVVVSVSTGGAAGGAAAASGGALIDGLNQSLEKEPAKPAPIPAPQAEPLPPQPEPPVPDPLPESPLGGPVYLENGVLLDGEFFTYTDILTRMKLENALTGKEDPLPNKAVGVEILEPPPAAVRDISLSQRFFEAIGRGVIADLSHDPEFRPALPQEATRTFQTAGIRQPHLRIGGINGMNTTLDEALGHASYVKKFAPEQAIEWVYNHSNGPAADVFEIGGLNLFGYSPNTAKLLQENWTAFHTENQNRPHAKYLHFCHSQGGFHTKNALASCPKEVRNRIIVVNVGAATIISRKECYQAFNYASRNDLVKFAELGWFGGWDSSEVGVSPRFEQILKEREEIILLPSHPDQIGMGHGFQDPTLKDSIKRHVEDYFEHNGEYK